MAEYMQERNLSAALQWVQDFVWGPPLLIMLLGMGVYLMILLRGLPLLKLPLAVSLCLKPGNSKEEVENNAITPFSALCTELAATIGTGNIVGVVSAIMLGGPGALWWMFLSCILGLATKLVESTLSVKYRITTREGTYLGGPMITLKRCIPQKHLGAFLSCIYAALAVLCAFGMGNMVQANSMAGSLELAFGTNKRMVGLITEILILLAVLGGVQVISGISSFLVPAMGVLYLLGCAGIIFMNRENLIPALIGSLHAVIQPKAVSGGIFGTVTVSFFDGLRWGVSRGIFSNEAGLGASGISAAASKERDPVRQGLISMTGVFFDTMIICMITGLTFCASGVMERVDAGGLLLQNGSEVTRWDGVGLMIAVFEDVYGKAGVILLSVSITLFAFATILGWGYQGEQAFRFLFRGRGVLFYRIAYGFASFLGATMALNLVWSISDVCNALLAIPNLICISLLARNICAEIRQNVHF